MHKANSLQLTLLPSAFSKTFTLRAKDQNEAVAWRDALHIAAAQSMEQDRGSIITVTDARWLGD
jgi:hypothetical protein